MLFAKEQSAPCSGDNAELFFSPVEDGREEVGRVEREALAGMICHTECPFRVACLERAMVTNEPYGVWGGMGEGERRKFRQHLIDEGYGKHETPSGRELQSSLVAYYYLNETPEEKYHGAADVDELLAEFDQLVA